MKRFLGFLLVISMMLSLCACNGTFQGNEGSNDNDTSENKSEIERRLLELPPEDGWIDTSKTYVCSTPDRTILGFAHDDFPVIHVKYLGKTVNLESTEKRAEYKFEVIEWIRGASNDPPYQISVYSDVRISKSSISRDPVEERSSEMYYYEYSTWYRFRYEIGMEYIICPIVKGDGTLYMECSTYLPLEVSEAPRVYGMQNISAWRKYVEFEADKLVGIDLVNFIKQVIAQYEDYEGNRIPVPSDSAG